MNRRATFMENGNNFLEVNTTANTIESCLEYDASVKYSLDDVYKPIDIEMHYQILNSVPQTYNGIQVILLSNKIIQKPFLFPEFCEYCLAVNPDDAKVSSNKIVFNVGCASERCVADLKLSSAVIEP